MQRIEQATGSVNNRKKTAENPRSGWKLTARCPENVDTVRDSVWQSPKKSLWRHSQELGLSRASLQRILKKDLHLYPDRIQIKHKLTPTDMEFLVSVINQHRNNGLLLFCGTLYIELIDSIWNDFLFLPLEWTTYRISFKTKWIIF